MLAGLVAGAVQGMRFHDEHWLGGYGSWKRRMTRLGHVAFLGTGLINLGFALSVQHAMEGGWPVRWASGLLILGALGMPVVCYVAAWRVSLRHLFVFPVACLVAGIGLFLVVLAGS